MATNRFKQLSLSRVYQLIEPGPVVLLTTALKGRANVMTMSWHMMLDFEPPLIACIVSNRNHSFSALKKTKECVIAIPAVKLAAKVVKVGNCSGRSVDKFGKFRLTPMPAAQVAAPLIGECFANLECRVVDTVLVTRYNLFVLEAVGAWRDSREKNPRMIHHQGYGKFAVDGKWIRLASRMR
jgi:flavin reductase (DIM6/NTAB) family NADH-FMN oxidoreductase RutF